MSSVIPARADDASELARFWPAVLACFVTAIFGWGFGFTGTSVYLAELQRLHGWKNAVIASAITEYYLIGAFCLTQIHLVLRRLGPVRLLLAGVGLLGAGATLFAWSQQPWQLFGAAIPMALGWASCTSTAISTSLALFFHRQRGLAITLALNGASVAGFTVSPALLELSHRIGLTRAVPIVFLCMLSVAVPLILAGLRAPDSPEAIAPPDPAASGSSARATLHTSHFWSIALPFALALAAQVGLIVHLVTFALPTLGPSGAATAIATTSIAAVSGRLALAGVIDRLPQRQVSALSFTSQAAGVALMALLPREPVALYAGCIIFGLSVGNVITLPALIVQREYPASAFGLVIGLSTATGQFTFALAPAFLGVLRDVTGGYTAVLAMCIALQLGAAMLVWPRTRRGRPRVLSREVLP